MRPFEYARAASVPEALRLAASGANTNITASTEAPAQFVAGGTLLLDLMKLGSMQPTRLVDINGLADRHGRIEASADGLRLGALVRMAAAAEHPAIRRD